MDEQNLPPAAPPLPYAWLPTLLGASSALLVLACGVVLTVQHLASRPLDLRGATLSAAGTIETSLLSNRVPESGIRASEEFRATDSAEYHYVEYDVTVPGVVSVERLREVLRRQLQQLGVSADASQGARGEPILELVVADQIFGYVRLTPEREDAWHSWPVVEEESGAVPAEVTPGPEVAVEVVPPADATEAAPETASPDVLEPTDEEPAPAAALPTGDETMAPNEEPVSGAPTSAAEAIQSGWTPPVQTASRPVGTAMRNDGTRSMRVAIIVDDGGYGGEVTERVLALDPGLTLSILPYTPHAAETAERAAELGFEVLLHMPMENLEDNLTHEGQLEVGMSPAAIGALTLQALDDVPGAVGVNNHMGSKFTSDRLSMRFFIDAIKDHELFFIDSRTTADSCAYEIAYEAGIPVGYRNIFLDHESDPAAIEEQFRAMMTMVEESGKTIAIAHFRPSTVDVLERMLPMLEDAGIELVHASELLP